MDAPYGPTQPAPPAERRPGGVVGPLVLIFLGGVFLLQNLGVLSPTVWGNLWRLWPVVLVLVGLELLFGRRMMWLAAIAGLCLVVLTLGYASTTFVESRPASVGYTEQSYHTALDGASQAAVTIRYGAGQLAVGALNDAASDELAEMTYDGPPDLANPPTYSVSGGTGRLEYQISGRGGPGFLPFGADRNAAPQADIELTPAVPYTTFTVQTGATDARLDLSKLRIETLDMSIGAASTWVRLPEQGSTSVHVSSGAANITIEVPPGVAAQIRHRGGLSSFNVNQTRFPVAETTGSGETIYRSPDWATAQNKVDITLETGVTTIQVN